MKLNSPYIMKYYQIFDSNQQFFFIMKMYDKNLEQFLKMMSKNKLEFSMRDLKYIFLQIALGL